MVIGVLTIELDIPHANSLKVKRGVLNMVKDRVHNKFNVSIAEVEANDVWNYACLGVCMIANQQRYVNEVLDKIVNFVGELRDCQLVDHGIDFVRLSSGDFEYDDDDDDDEEDELDDDTR